MSSVNNIMQIAIYTSDTNNVLTGILVKTL